MARNNATQPQANAPCAHNNAEAIHWPADTSGSRPRQEAATPFNTALSDLHPDHLTLTTSSLRRHPVSSADARNARNKWPTTWLESVRGHGPCQTKGASQTPRGLCKPRLRRRMPTHPARTRTSGDASTRRNASHHSPTQDTYRILQLP